MNNVIVFVNRSITPDFNTKLVGHVGWGFLTPSGEWLYGSKETTNKLAVGNREPNGVFIKKAPFNQMIADIKKGNMSGGPIYKYHQYKLMQCRNTNPAIAEKKAYDSPNWGYGLIGNNCMDDVYKIITAYANGDGNFLPWPSTHPFPNHFFDDIKSPAMMLNPY